VSPADPSLSYPTKKSFWSGPLRGTCNPNLLLVFWEQVRCGGLIGRRSGGLGLSRHHGRKIPGHGTARSGTRCLERGAGECVRLASECGELVCNVPSAARWSQSPSSGRPGASSLERTGMAWNPLGVRWKFRRGYGTLRGASRDFYFNFFRQHKLRNSME
jgi:hypothetical protein